MQTSLIIRDAGIEDIETIGYLAHQIWPNTYKDILEPGQLKYMLDLIYSPKALKEQIQKHHHHFLIAEAGDEQVGFASYSEIEKGVYKLQKIYVLTTLQGRGVGKALLDTVIENIKSKKAKSLLLNVNRHNQAKTFYEKIGFAVIREEDIDIGNGFFMNDYVMEKKLIS